MLLISTTLPKYLQKVKETFVEYKNKIFYIILKVQNKFVSFSLFNSL